MSTILQNPLALVEVEATIISTQSFSPLPRLGMESGKGANADVRFNPSLYSRRRCRLMGIPLYFMNSLLWVPGVSMFMENNSLLYKSHLKESRLEGEEA